MISLKIASKFEEIIKEEKVLVAFTADWSSPSKMIEMVLEDIEAEQPELKIVKVDSDRFRSIAKNYSVVNLPVLIIFSNGKVVKQQSGFMRREELLAFISE